MYLRRFLTTVLSFLALAGILSAQNLDGQTDSVVVLMNAKSIQLLEIGGEPYRKAIEARFLHNNTYLLCDTALWNVNRNVINANSNVQIIQDNTSLTSDELEYLVDLDLARFRGSLVQLKDKEGNILRTNYLDYNTKDSTAYFERGASMKDKDGQVIESEVGEYDSKNEVFTFDRNVNMYTDSVFIKTSRLYYYTAVDSAVFTGGLDAWKDDNMISSFDGHYNRKKDRFFFHKDVHIMSDSQEGWSDSLYFSRLTNDIEMYGNVQMTDTSRHVSALSNKLIYVDKLSQLTMMDHAVVIAEADDGKMIDTVYFGADKFVYWTLPKCDVPQALVKDANTRLENLSADPISTYRAKSAQEAAKAAEDAAASDPNRPPQRNRKDTQGNSSSSASTISQNARKADVEALKISNEESSGEESPQTSDEEPLLAQSDSLTVAPDSIALAMARQQAIRDSLANRDTSAVGFLRAMGNIKVFKSDMQMSCDSLEYSDLDSLARLFIRPLVWNEGNRQYSSDSIYLSVKGQKMDKANLMSNAFIIIEEEPELCYDQIRSAEIMAYFDSSTVLKRFDALGGANALFYLKENDAFATVNKVESKMLTANFVKGELDRIYYFDSPKNDAYPVVQLPESEKRMKGFNWMPELRPKSGMEISPLRLKPLAMDEYRRRPSCVFMQTHRYFPGYIDSVRQMLASRDSLKAARRMEEQYNEQALENQEAQESLSLSDSLSLTDSLGHKAMLDSLGTLGHQHLPDSLAAGEKLEMADSLAVNEQPLDVPEEERLLTPEELRAKKEAEKKLKLEQARAKREMRRQAKEAKWAELDKRDAEKAAKKAAKQQEKYRKRTLKKVIAAEKAAERDRKRLEKYIEAYEKKMARKQINE